MNRKGILEAAQKCVCTDREESYGSPEDNFRTVAGLWREYLHAGHGVMLSLEEKDVAAMMALLKIARIATGTQKEDNWIDLAGYAACGGEVQTEREREI